MRLDNPLPQRALGVSCCVVYHPGEYAGLIPEGRTMVEGA